MADFPENVCPEKHILKLNFDSTGLHKPFIFFDIGSTLMDGPDFSPASRFMKELDLSPADKETVNSFLFTENITHPDQLIRRFRELLPHIPESVDEKIKSIWNAQVSEGFVIEGAMEAIRSLSERGYRMGIISNIWHPYYLCFERLFAPVLDRFGSIILSYRVGSRKPDEGIFRVALDSLKGLYNNREIYHNNKWEHSGKEAVEPEGFAVPQETGVAASSTVIVGDSYYHDIAPAIKMGMKTIWVLREYKRDAAYMRDVLSGRISGPDVSLREIGELARPGR